MDRRKWIAITGILLILGIIVVAKFIKHSTPAKEIHYHAGFVVFDSGQKVDFSDSKYMFIKPCSVDSDKHSLLAYLKKDDAKTAQIEKAHLHDGVGDVVHIEAEGSEWGDLFTNIGYPVDYSKVTAYINGSQVANIQNTPIKAYDSLVLFVGPVDKNVLSQAVTIDHIKTVESESVECGD